MGVDCLNYVDQILHTAEIIGGETYFPEQPRETYAAWGDAIEADGSDHGNELQRHEVEIELYELMDKPDPGAHERLQKTLNAEALRWRKEPRVLDTQFRLFMTRYTFFYTERVEYDE